MTAQTPSCSRRGLLAATSAAAVGLSLKHAWGQAAALPKVSASQTPGAGWPVRAIMRPQLQDSLDHRLLNKPVAVARRLDAPAERWSATPGARVTRLSAAGDGVRLESPMRNEAYLAAARAPNGSSDGGAGYLQEGGGANFWRLAMAPAQDWSAFNRVSFEIFVHDTGLDAYGFGVGFVEAGRAPLGPSDPLSFTFVQDLVVGQWSRVVWEIPELPRRNVVEFAIFQPLRGPVGRVTYDVRKLALEKVDVEQVEGWEVAPGRIAFNHVGYRPSDPKSAFVEAGSLATFDVLDAATGAVVRRFAAHRRDTRLGGFTELDFSDLSAPGRYRLRAGTIESRSFAIAEDLWLPVVEKLLNFFYADRCGHAAPGLHGVCHQDLMGERNGIKKPINGGWHDAGNLSQGSYRTAVSTEGLLAAYEQLAARQDQPSLAARAREEACWGLDWLLRSRFGDGYRVTELSYAYYTDNRLGGVDDMVRPTVFDTFENLLFARVAAEASRLLRTAEPDRARRALAAAIEDYSATLGALPGAERRKAGRNSAAPYQEYAYGVLAALALYRATGAESYRLDAVDFGDRLLACQHRDMVGASGITGFFYEDETKAQPSAELHTSFADAAPRALVELSQAFPRHPTALQWRAALVLYSDGFLKAGSTVAEPYGHLPNAVWRRDQFARFVDRQVAEAGFFPPDLGYKYIPALQAEALRSGYQQEFDAGFALTEDVRLRTFPIPPDPVFHGNTTIQAAMTAGLRAVADFRGDATLQRLATRQLNWMFGGNPFSNCLMYGEGYDYPSQFQTVARNMVGAMPVGMSNCRDRPFWPTAAQFTFKEMWVVPAAQLLKALAFGLRPPAEPVGFGVSAASVADRGPQVEVVATGRGPHRLRLEVWNGQVADRSDVELSGPGRHVWTIRPANVGKPWVAVVRRDGPRPQSRDCWGVG